MDEEGEATRWRGEMGEEERRKERRKERDGRTKDGDKGRGERKLLYFTLSVSFPNYFVNLIGATKSIAAIAFDVIMNVSSNSGSAAIVISGANEDCTFAGSFLPPPYLRRLEGLLRFHFRHSNLPTSG